MDLAPGHVNRLNVFEYEYFPLQEKQEGWWLYVSDKKTHMLITAPVQIQTLKTEEEVRSFSVLDDECNVKSSYILKNTTI